MFSLTLSTVVLVLMFLLYYFLLFEFVDTILKNPRLKRIYRVPVGLFNVGLSLFVSMLWTNEHSSTLAFLVITLVLLAEIYIFYKDTLLRVLFITLACSVHIMAICAVSAAAVSMINGLSLYETSHDPFLLALVLNIALALLCGFFILLIKFLPAKSIRIINQHSNQLIFMVVWLAIANLYFLFNAQIYGADDHFAGSHLDFVIQNQLMVSLAMLSGVYIALFFTIKTGALLNYKEENEELLQVVENQQQIRDSVFSDTIAVYEANLTKDIITKGFEDNLELLKAYNYKYSEILKAVYSKMVFDEDAEKFLNYASIENLLADFRSGKNETEIEYRRLMPDGNYIWVKAVANIFRDKASGDIKAFAYMKDINDEKNVQLEMKHRAERDSLTGLYNKGTTEMLISEHLSGKSEPLHGGALLIIDVDNFKAINDNFGHSFGDAVLSELADKLRSLFRSLVYEEERDNREDIIGRIGGDEFMVFIKGVNNEQVIASKAEKICEAFERTYKSDDGEAHTISASIGVSLFQKNGKDFTELYKQADIALYLSKGKGKNAYSFYNGEGESA